MSLCPDESFRIPCALRRVPPERMAQLVAVPGTPRSGDIVLARVASIGKNTRLELASGRPCNLHEGDLIAAVFGNRYATAQFEGYAKCDGEACDLLSMGGVCGLVASKHDKVLEPSKLVLQGAIADAHGRPLRLKDFAVPQPATRAHARTVAVCGSAMDSGKTFTAMSLILGLRKLGEPVAAVKLTGTAAGRDSWVMQDAGADPVLDFVDGGLPSTYMCTLEELLELDRLLVGRAAAQGASWVVIEIADGLLQRETSALLHCPRFTATVDAWMFAASEPLAAVAGVELLQSIGLKPLAISGMISMSPLAMREATERTGVSCLTGAQLARGALNDRLAQSRPAQLNVAP
jgi:hypothetical protein